MDQNVLIPDFYMVHIQQNIANSSPLTVSHKLRMIEYFWTNFNHSHIFNIPSQVTKNTHRMNKHSD